MKTYKKIEEHPRLSIYHDDCPESPREWSNLGYFITKDSNYLSPDKHEQLEEIVISTGDDAKDGEDHMEMIKKRVREEMTEKVLAIYPVTKYEHSGIAYSLGNSRGWDYSNNGFYIITDKSIKECGTEKKYWEDNIRAEIETYNKYVNGEVYRFTLYDDKGEYEDSCCGFYDIEDIREHLPKEWKNEDLDEYLNN